MRLLIYSLSVLMMIFSQSSGLMAFSSKWDPPKPKVLDCRNISDCKSEAKTRYCRYMCVKSPKCSTKTLEKMYQAAKMCKHKMNDYGKIEMENDDLKSLKVNLSIFLTGFLIMGAFESGFIK